MNLFTGFLNTGREKRRSREQGRRLLAAAAAGVLAVGALTGCGGKTRETAGGPDTAASAEQGSGSGNGMPAAKGRYMETDIPLPEDAAGREFISCGQNEDGSISIYVTDGEAGYAEYAYDEAGWKEKKSIPKSGGCSGAKRIFRGQDGRQYLVEYDENYQFHLGQLSDTGEAADVFSDLFKVPEGKEFGMMPDYMDVLANGNLLISEISSAGVYSTDGRKLFPMAQDYGGMDVRIAAYSGRGSYLTLLEGRLVRYDTATGEQTGSFDIPEKKNTMIMNMFEGNDGGIYAAGNGGLYHTHKDGTVWEQMIDGSLNSMGRQDMDMRGFFPGGEDDYYGVYYKWDEKQVVFIRYAFDETVDAVPPETLSVYALRDNASVRQAMAILQKDNPQIRVDLRIAAADEQEAVSEDVIRALNTELLNKKGADVLILDGLPAEVYKEKGILTDMGALFAEMDSELLANVTAGYREQDGSIFYMPARVQLPVVYGEPEAADAFKSLDKMASYDKNPPLLVPNLSENILRLWAHTCYREIFQEDGSIEAETLKKYLEAIKLAGERGGVKTDFTEAEVRELGLGRYIAPQGFGGQNAFDLGQKKCGAAAELLTSMDSAMLPVAVMEQDNYRMQDINGIYLPIAMAGINSSASNPEAAKEFIRILFGAQVQNEYFNDGFPVRYDSLDRWRTAEKDSMVSVGSPRTDYSLSGGWPSPDQRDMISRLVQTVDIPVVVDNSIMQMIVDGSGKYLEGKETLEGAVAAIENKIGLYMAEKE